MQTLYYVGSVSHALRGRQVLEKHGIRAYIRRVQADRRHGCGYGLLVTHPTPAIMNILRSAGVSAEVVQGRESP